MTNKWTKVDRVFRKSIITDQLNEHWAWVNSFYDSDEQEAQDYFRGLTVEQMVEEADHYAQTQTFLEDLQGALSDKEREYVTNYATKLLKEAKVEVGLA